MTIYHQLLGPTLDAENYVLSYRQIIPILTPLLAAFTSG